MMYSAPQHMKFETACCLHAAERKLCLYEMYSSTTYNNSYTFKESMQKHLSEVLSSILKYMRSNKDRFEEDLGNK